ncbi:MAG TPA: class I SAM-dependent methyltransferase [Nocardioidaceae bacterium]|nr:class I SAM-dependent methyltransferase [Nocardioidaceae bacterium]
MPSMSKSERSMCLSRPWRSIARRIVPWATLDTALSGDVLEIGGGGGAMAEALAASHPHVRLTMTDVDPVMVDVARRRLAHVPDVSLCPADVTALPYPDASFDTVTSFLMLHHVIDWEKAVAEVARVLRPGGVFVGYDLTATRIATVIHLADDSPYRLIRRGEFESQVATAGLGLVRMQYSAFGHVFRFVAAHQPSR